MSDDKPALPEPSKYVQRQTDIVNKELHSQARQLIEQLTLDFATSLLVQAKTLAQRRDDEIVLRHHVDEALESIQQERKRKRGRDLAGALGGVSLGAFLQGFPTELLGGRDPMSLVFFVVLGLLGVLLLAVGFRR
jgi:hypothetical protein